MSFKEFITGFTSTARTLIQKYEDYKELEGSSKKDLLDNRMIKFTENALDKSGLNVFIKWAIKTFLIKAIPDITQAIFDLIKTRVEGITEEKDSV